MNRALNAFKLSFLVLCLAGCGDSADSAGDTPIQEPRDYPDSPAGSLLRDHVDFALGTGREAEANYQASLERLRQDPDAMVDVILDVYTNLDEDRYVRRWLLIETLRELRAAKALTALEGIAQTPIPEERWSDDEAFSQDKEVSIRTTAVAAIAEIAKGGNEEADAALQRFFEHPNAAVRRVAVIGFLAAREGDTTRVELLRRTLSSDDLPFIEASATDPRVVPHPEVSDAPLEAPIADGSAPRIEED